MPSGAPAAGRPPAGSAPSVAPLALAPGNRYSAAFPRYRHGPVAHFKRRKQSLLFIKVPVPSGDGIYRKCMYNTNKVVLYEWHNKLSMALIRASLLHEMCV